MTGSITTGEMRLPLRLPQRTACGDAGPGDVAWAMAADRYSIRIAGLPDAIAVSELFMASYSRLLPSSYDPAQLAAALPLVTKPNPRLLASGTFYLATIESGQVVGCGGWSVEPPEGIAAPGEASLRHFATHPDWIRQGIGRAIVLRCFEEARALGFTGMRCHASFNAVDFYRALGFAVVRTIEMRFAPSVTFPGVLMKCSLG